MTGQDPGAIVLTAGALRDAIEHLREAMTEALGDRHRYLSTSCLHGRHGRCRLVCKYCDDACVCPCHLAEQAGEVESAPLKVAA